MFLSVIVPDFVVPVAEMVPEIDEIIVFPKKNMLGIFRFALKLFSTKWDTSINLNPSCSSSAKIVNRFTGAMERIGFRNDRDSSIFTMLAEKPEKDEHMLDSYRRLAETAGFRCDTNPCLVPNETEQNDADTMIKKLELTDYIVIHPGNFGKVRSRWPEDKFITLSKMIAERKQIKQVMLAGPGEEKHVKAIVDAVNSDRVIMVYNIPLKVTAAFLARAKAFIGNSTGTQHMADALGVPTVCVSNMYSYKCWRPFRESAVTIKSDDWRDLSRITPEQVYEGLLELEKKNGITLD